MSNSRAQGADGVAGGGGIGRVGLDEQGRPGAAEKVAGEILRDVDDELDFATRQRGVCFRFGSDLPHEVEVAAVSDGLQQRAALRAAVGHEQGRGQVLGV